MADAQADEWELLSSSGEPTPTLIASPAPSSLVIACDAEEYSLVDRDEPANDDGEGPVLVPPSPEGVLSTDGDSEASLDVQHMDDVANQVIKTTPVQSAMAASHEGASSAFFLDQQSLSRLLQRAQDEQLGVPAGCSTPAKEQLQQELRVHAGAAAESSTTVMPDCLPEGTPAGGVDQLPAAGEPALQLPKVFHAAADASSSDQLIKLELWAQEQPAKVTVRYTPAPSPSAPAASAEAAAGPLLQGPAMLQAQGAQQLPLMVLVQGRQEAAGEAAAGRNIAPAAAAAAAAAPADHADGSTARSPRANGGSAEVAAGSSKQARGRSASRKHGGGSTSTATSTASPSSSASWYDSRRAGRQAGSRSASQAAGKRGSRRASACSSGTSRSAPPSPSPASSVAFPAQPGSTTISVQAGSAAVELHLPAAAVPPAVAGASAGRGAPARQQPGRRRHGGLLQWLLPGVMLVVALHHLAVGGHEHRQLQPSSCHSCSNDPLSADLWLTTAELSSA